MRGAPKMRSEREKEMEQNKKWRWNWCMVKSVLEWERQRQRNFYTSANLKGSANITVALTTSLTLNENVWAATATSTTGNVAIVSKHTSLELIFYIHLYGISYINAFNVGFTRCKSKCSTVGIHIFTCSCWECCQVLSTYSYTNIARPSASKSFDNARAYRTCTVY